MLELLAINIIVSLLVVPLLAPLLGFNSRLAVPANDCTDKRLKKHRLHMQKTEPLRKKVTEDDLLFIEQSAWLAESRRRKSARNDVEYDQRPAKTCAIPVAINRHQNAALELVQWQEQNYY